MAKASDNPSQTLLAGLPPLLTPNQLLETLGISRITLWRLMRDPAFPRPLRTSPNPGRASRRRYVRAEIEAWLASRPRRVDV